MFNSLETGIGLDVVLWFQGIRFGLFDAIATALHHANDGIFYIVVFGIIYWMFDKRLGMRGFFALIVISIVTFVAKDLLARPRPFTVSDAVIPLVAETGYGIPSGHSAMPFVIWGYIALWIKNRWFTVGVVVYVILQGLSRLYLGVHFPQDVIFGWLLGAVVLVIYARSVEPVVAWWKEQSLVVQLVTPIGIALVSLAYFLSTDNENGITIAGLLIGAAVAVIVESNYIHFTHLDAMARRAIQFVLGLVIAILVLEGLDIVFEAIEPPTYAYIETNADQAQVLADEVSISVDDPTAVCAAADEADSDSFSFVCRVDVTPLAAILRLVRYFAVTVFALALIPEMSIRAKLMQRESATA